MAENRLPSSSTEAVDWALLIARLAHSVGLVILLVITNNTTSDDWILATAVSFAVSLIMVLMVLIPVLQPYAAWGVMVGDWILMLVFSQLVIGDLTCTARNLEYILSDLSTGADIPTKISFEVMRWTSAVRDARAGIDGESIREKLGLSRISWTETSRKIERLIEMQERQRLSEQEG